MNQVLEKNLTILNKWLAANKKNVVLHLIGGYALFLKGVGNRYTVDIKTVSEIEDGLKS